MRIEKFMKDQKHRTIIFLGLRAKFRKQNKNFMVHYFLFFSSFMLDLKKEVRSRF